MDKTALENRVMELEIRLTHYEDTIEQLNQAIISQGSEIDVLKVQLEHLNKKLKSAQGSILADEKDETPPPHY
ncbi:MAG TPA: SlyX family protein [Thiotrichales bacterium]|nr:SlyX family protein [Thiotrichales bacterium]